MYGRYLFQVFVGALSAQLLTLPCALQVRPTLRDQHGKPCHRPRHLGSRKTYLVSRGAAGSGPKAVNVALSHRGVEEIGALRVHGVLRTGSSGHRGLSWMPSCADTDQCSLQSPYVGSRHGVGCGNVHKRGSHGSCVRGCVKESQRIVGRRFECVWSDARRSLVNSSDKNHSHALCV